jgi:chorismate synthase
LTAFLQRRAPGKAAFTTSRKEPDQPEFLCGVVDGVTCGAPLTAIIRNTNTRSQDYDELRDCPRPSHADYAAQVRYNGQQDVRGGGHFSGRLTAPLCIAGGIAKQILSRRGVEIGAHIASVGEIEDQTFDPVRLTASDFTAGKKDFPVLDDQAGQKMQEAIAACRSEGDSIGGTVECGIVGLPAGIGDPMFDGLENHLAAALFGIPAVKGLEFGLGFGSSRLRGSENNDPYRVQDGKVVTETNHAGGFTGGITTGMPILFHLAFKPTPSISLPQKSISLSEMKNRELIIRGRHDPCIVPRAVPVVEAVSAIVVLDDLLSAEKGCLWKK